MTETEASSTNLKQQRIDQFKKTIEKMIATSKAALIKSDSREVMSRNRFRKDYTKDDIHRIIAGGSALEKAELSEYFFSVSGIYKRIILHYAGLLTYSWLVIPHNKKIGEKITNKKYTKAYYDAADFCSNFGIERKCTLFAKEVLVDGGYYGIIHDNGANVAIQNLPFEYCRSRFKNSQDVDIVEFDTRYFDKEIKDEELRKQILKTYPKIVQKGYRTYKNSGKNPWIFLPAEIGIYFCLFEEKPFFLDLIPLIDELEDYKQIDKERKMLSLKRIVAQEVPHDGMNLVFEPDEAQEMHEGALEMLSNNDDVDVITTYAKVSLLDLSGDDEHTEVSEAQQLIYDSAGVSKELFSATTAAGLEMSANNDLSMMMVLGQSFSHFFTTLLNNKFGNAKLSFSLVILPVTYDNSNEYTSKAKDLGAFGYSFLTPILSTGINQTNLADLKALEIGILKLDEVLKPLQSSYTQSGKTNAITAQAAKDENKTTKEKDNVNADSDDESSERNEDSSNTSVDKKSDGGEDKE